MRWSVRRGALIVATSALAFGLTVVPPLAKEDSPMAAVPVPELRPDGAPGAGETPPDKASGPAKGAAGGNGSPASGPGRLPEKPGEAGRDDAAGRGPDRLKPARSAGENPMPGPASERPIGDIPVPETRPAATIGDAAPVAPKTPATKAAKPDVTGSADPGRAPDKLKAREAAITPAAAVLAAAAIEDAKMCEAELEKRGVLFTIGESISEGACGVLRPVNIERLSSGVAVSSGTKLLCRSALALDRWMTDSVVPAAKASFPTETLTEFRHASTYVCRTRASENGISEHARGSAVDIAAFAFRDGTRIGVEAHPPDSPEARFQRAVREGACGPFKTVLGPGTDADHATHFHLDIAARLNGGTYCK
ncbi:MAG TPA: extensin family protein [Aurantimonas sp.]